MIPVVLALLVLVVIVLISEYLGQRKILRGEAARKSVHILGATFIATWPFFMSFRTIVWLSLAFIALILLVRYFNLLDSLHDISRRSAGDVMFALGITGSALITNNEWIFAAAMLHLGLADGIAALVGTNFKSQVLVNIHGEKRTLAGTISFFLVSLAILGWVTLIAPSGLHEIAVYIPFIATLATAVEFVSILGSDNVLVPLYITTILQSLR